MTIIEMFIQGIISGLGMVTIMTIFSMVTYRLLRKWIETQIVIVWDNIKSHVDYSGSIDFKELHKDEHKRNNTNS